MIFAIAILGMSALTAILVAVLQDRTVRDLAREVERLRRRNDQLCEAIADRHTAREAVVDRRERLFGTI